MRVDQERIDLAVNLYKQGIGVNDIAKELECHRLTIYNYLRHGKITCNRKTKANVDCILELYHLGMSIQDISISTNIDRGIVSHILKGYNLNTTDRSRSNKVNFNPFLDLLNPDVQYWLGYLAADGNVYGNRVRIYSNKDPNHLREYISFIGVDLKLEKNGKDNYCVSFCNRHVANYLIKLGITPNKSKTLSINMPMTFPFLRGVFDGDGHITQRSKNYTEVGIATASLIFKEQICNFLSYKDIHYRVSYFNPCHRITISRKLNVRKFYYLLYESGSYFLDRKRIKFTIDNDIVWTK